MESTRKPNASGALRVAAAGSLVLIALISAGLGVLRFVYRASSGCEDYGIACHEAEPVQAGLELAVIAASVGCLLLAAFGLLSHRRPKPLVPGLAATGLLSLWIVLVVVDLDLGG